MGRGNNFPSSFLLLPSCFFALPFSFFLLSFTSVTSVTESVAELPSSFFLLSFTSVTSVTSVTESVAELPSSFYPLHPLHPLHPLQNPLPNFLLPFKTQCRHFQSELAALHQPSILPQFSAPPPKFLLAKSSPAAIDPHSNAAFLE